MPDDGSTAVTSGAPCAKSNRPSVSRAAASRSADVRYFVERGAAIFIVHSLGAIEEGAELVRVQIVAQLAWCVGFDLADALAARVPGSS